MTDYVGNMSLKRDTFNAKGARKFVVLQAQTTIGAAGAIGTQTVDDPAITFTKNGGTGDLAITFPKCAACHPVVSIVSVGNTVNSYNIKALDAAAGTLNIITLSAATATNGASGDIVKVLLFCEAE